MIDWHGLKLLHYVNIHAILRDLLVEYVISYSYVGMELISISNHTFEYNYRISMLVTVKYWMLFYA